MWFQLNKVSGKKLWLFTLSLYDSTYWFSTEKKGQRKQIFHYQKVLCQVAYFPPLTAMEVGLGLAL